MGSRAVLWFLVAVIPVRIALDAAWRLPNAGPLTAPQAGGAALAVGIAAAVALRWRAAATHPARVPMALFALAVGIGAARADRWFDAARYGVAYLAPVGWALALWAWPEVGARGPPRAWTVAAAVAAASSVACLATGQPADHVLHGWPRLIGVYGNLHGHAAAMAAFAVTLGALGAAQRAPGPAAVGVVAALCVGATWVRGAWAWVGIGWLVAAGVYAWSADDARERRRARAVAGGLVAAGALGLAVGAIRARWADVGAIATLTPPDGGWGALGSWRGRIWADVVHNHLAGGWADAWFGRGLGGQLGLHRHLDPHSDALSLLVALGPLGLAAWFGWLGATAVAVVRARAADPALAAAAVGALAGALAVAVVSNDVLDRPTPLWWVVGAAAIALTPPLGPRVRPAASASGAGTAAPRAPTPG